jgi:hypothetical protein
MAKKRKKKSSKKRTSKKGKKKSSHKGKKPLALLVHNYNKLGRLIRSRGGKI